MENEEKSDLDTFVASSLRGPRQTVREQLLCKKLVKANRCNKLQRIVEISEAAYFAKEMNPKLELDLELVDVLHKVSISLATPQTIYTNIFDTKNIENLHATLEAYPGIEVVKRISWNFEQNEENFEKYIRPWIVEVRFLSNRMPLYEKMEKIIEDLKSVSDDPQQFNPTANFFFMICTFLTEAGLEQLKTNFVSWANPKATAIEETLCQLVSPDVLMEFFKADKEENKSE